MGNAQDLSSISDSIDLSVRQKDSALHFMTALVQQFKAAHALLMGSMGRWSPWLLWEGGCCCFILHGTQPQNTYWLLHSSPEISPTHLDGKRQDGPMMALDVLHSSETQFETRNKKNPMSATQNNWLQGGFSLIVVQ